VSANCFASFTSESVSLAFISELNIGPFFRDPIQYLNLSVQSNPTQSKLDIYNLHPILSNP